MTNDDEVCIPSLSSILLAVQTIMFRSFINYPIGSLTLRATQIHGEVRNVIATEFRSDKYYSECSYMSLDYKSNQRPSR